MNIPPVHTKHIMESKRKILETGKVKYREYFIGPPKRGKMITIFGDTKYKDEHASFAKNSDVLVHEATFEADKEQLATNYFHSTTVQAAQIAKNANVNTLLLTHVSSRYLLEDMRILEKEAQDIFPNSYIAYDFYTFQKKKE